MHYAATLYSPTAEHEYPATGAEVDTTTTILAWTHVRARPCPHVEVFSGAARSVMQTPWFRQTRRSPMAHLDFCDAKHALHCTALHCPVLHHTRSCVDGRKAETAESARASIVSGFFTSKDTVCKVELASQVYGCSATRNLVDILSTYMLQWFSPQKLHAEHDFFSCWTGHWEDYGDRD